jgi:hypothetical protein
MPKPNPAEDESLRNLAIEVLQKKRRPDEVGDALLSFNLLDLLEITSIERIKVERAEWRRALFSAMHSVSNEITTLKFTINLFNDLSEYISNIKDDSGLRARYFFNSQNGSFIVITELKKYGILPSGNGSFENIDEDINDDTDDNMDGLEEITESEANSIRIRSKNGLNAQLSALDNKRFILEGMMGMVEEQEEEGGVNVSYIIVEIQREIDGTIVSEYDFDFETVPKGEMCLVPPIAKEEPEITDEE